MTVAWLDTVEGDLEDVPEVARRGAFNSLENHTWILEEEGRWREGVRAYLASVAYADAMVGRLLDALDASGRADRTIVVLWGDHGFHLGEKDRWQKYTLWGESLHVPFVVVAPGVTQPGTISSAPVSLMDIYPTLAELAQLKPQPSLEGQSLVPLLDNPARAWKSAAFSVVTAPDGIRGEAAVTDRYRYVRWTGPHPDEELFDHRSDPREYTNLARDPKHADVLQRMRAVLDAGWQAARAAV